MGEGQQSQSTDFTSTTFIPFLKTQATQQHPYPDEIEIYLHQTEPRRVRTEALTEALIVRAIDEIIGLKPQSTFLVADNLSQQLTKVLPQRSYFLVSAESPLGHHYLLDCLLDHRHPIAVVKQGQPARAYGVDMSPFGFSVCGWLKYLKCDPEIFLKRAAASLIQEKAVLKGFDLKKETLEIVQYISKEYTDLLYQLKSILIDLDYQLVGKKMSQQEYCRCILALRWLVLESNLLPDGTLQKKNFHEKLEHIVDHAKKAVSTNWSFENEYEYLETSPLDGAPTLSDINIKHSILTNLDAAKPFLMPSSLAPFSEKEAELGIKKSRRFIDVLLSNQKGEVSYYTFPTLYHKYENAKDNYRLLREAGIKIKFSKLPTDRSAARTAALSNPSYGLNFS